MKASNTLIATLREVPAEAVIASHQLMLRAGLIRKLGNGLFTYFPLGLRAFRKVENIVREEMDAVGALECKPSVVVPGELWRESGRWETMGAGMLRMKNRVDQELVVSPTAEEAFTALVRDELESYKQLPLTLYQINTKYRDEIRPRYGVMRGREFTMKDAYSFHTSQEDLEQYYQKCYDAYNRIFKRAGAPNVVTVASDSGMMGGSISHEYMLLSEVGEDSIVICEKCDYRANMEAAENIVVNTPSGTLSTIECIETPDCKTIDDVCAFLKADVKSSCKAVVYQKNSDDAYVVAFVRGDYEVNETKLRNLVGEEIHPADITPDAPLVAGYIGPYGISDKVTYYIDLSLKGIENIVAGANKESFHLTGLNLERDLDNVVFYDIAKVKDGGTCPCCGKSGLLIKRGIEIGNIFQLGTKYTKSMNMQYVDKDGTLHNPIMGCYGIGVGRLAASICEAKHDDYGPIWPISIAPYEVHICCLRPDDENTLQVANTLYDNLKKAHADVIFDDREGVRGGQMFADADLIGAPIRVVVSPRNLQNNQIEISTRDKSLNILVDVSEAADYIINLKKTMLDELNN